MCEVYVNCMELHVSEVCVELCGQKCISKERTSLSMLCYCKFNRRLKSFNKRLAPSPIGASSYGKRLYGMLNI